MQNAARDLYVALIGLEQRAKAGRQRQSLPYSRRSAAATAGISEQRISDWVPKDPETAKVPHDAHGDFIALIHVWSDWAGETRVEQRYWANLIESAQPHRERTATLADPGPGIPIAEAADPFAFEVHHAIEVETTGAEKTLPPLTLYVRRAHDARLACAVESALEGRSVMVTLVGGSSCGKTRACWEAVHTLPDGWRLWHPLAPEHAEALVGDIDRVRPRTVIWLNEAQHYLDPRTSAHGEHAAGKLRELLRDPSRAPVLVLATLWPDYWRDLTSNAEPGGTDEHPHARMLLTGTEILVPERFDVTADQTARRAAQADPRLAAALDGAESGMVIQYLAAGPALLDRYRTAPPGARALIEAAMDARRLGHGLEIPLPMLKCAAPGYISDLEWDLREDDWLDKALDFCGGKVRGARGPLTQVHPRNGKDNNPHPSYRLADYLEQYGRESRRTVAPPATFWDACAQYAHPTASGELVRHARVNGLYSTAIQLIRRTTRETESVEAARITAFLARIGRADEAAAWYEAAAQPDVRYMSIDIAHAYRSAGRIDEALPWFRRAVEEAEPGAVDECRKMLVSAGRIETVSWLDEARGHSAAVSRIKRSEPDRARKLEDAVAALEKHADAGDATAYKKLADLLFGEEGYEDEHRFWAMQAAMAPQPAYRQSAYDFTELCDISCDGPPGSHVVDFLTEHALRGEKGALRPLASVIARCAHDHPAALHALLRLAAASNDEASWAVANYLEYSEYADAALAWFRQLSQDPEDPYVFEEFADLLWRSDHKQEALEQYWHVAEEYPGYEADFAKEAADRFKAVGRTYEAIEWYLKSVGPDAVQAYKDALRVATSRPHRAEILEHCGPLATAGDAVALWVLAQIALNAQKVDSILHWCPAAIAAGRDDILEPYVTWLTERGRFRQALDACTDAARAGEAAALPLAVSVLRSAGQDADADRLEHYGWAADYEIAEPWDPGLPPGSAASAAPE